MKRIHLICRNRDGITVLKMPDFESRAWDISEDEAKEIVGGMICFHETKAPPSYFGALVTGYRIEHTDNAHSARVVFTLTALPDAKSRAWSGRADVMASYSGIVESAT
ncbi:MAG: hypothetical protein GC182_02940 [Rhodopseudomonas sp.]|nr:hypothetical protein [Rhodopseudomonas sp.]